MYFKIIRLKKSPFSKRITKGTYIRVNKFTSQFWQYPGGHIIIERIIIGDIILLVKAKFIVLYSNKKAATNAAARDNIVLIYIHITSPAEDSTSSS